MEYILLLLSLIDLFTPKMPKMMRALSMDHIIDVFIKEIDHRGKNNVKPKPKPIPKSNRIQGQGTNRSQGQATLGYILLYFVCL